LASFYEILNYDNKINFKLLLTLISKKSDVKTSLAPTVYNITVLAIG